MFTTSPLRALLEALHHSVERAFLEQPVGGQNNVRHALLGDQLGKIRQRGDHFMTIHKLS